MLKKRLIFTFLVQDGRFMLSRNFSLQAVGDLQWVRQHYEFNAIAFSIDELIILDVTRGPRDIAAFAEVVREISKTCFMPIAAGGGVRSVEHARLLLKSGADKIVVNTPLFTEGDLLHRLVGLFGSQCVVASIDYRRTGNEGEVFIENGVRSANMTVPAAAARAQELGAGELYLTSITRDGTGQGLDLDYLSRIGASVAIPMIVAGGAGNFTHLSNAIQTQHVAAVSTANLFNFMGDSLTDARQHIIDEGMPLATWGRIATRPMTKISGYKVVLVPFGETHLSNPLYYGWVSDVEVMRFIGRDEYLKPITFEEVRAYVEDVWRNKYCSFFAIHTVSDNRFIGTAKINYLNDTGRLTRTADIGIMIGDKTYWGKGIATDALYSLCRYAFTTLNARKLTAGGLSGNAAILKAFRRIGFAEEGRIREKCLVEGEYMDHVLLGCFGGELIPLMVP